MIASDHLFLTIASNSESIETKLDLINELKTYVKKNYIDLTQVPKYLEALAIAVDISNIDVKTSSFSVVCHLVKRVSMQDKRGYILKSQGFLILPILIDRLGDSRASTVMSSKRALEAYWLSTPREVEDSILDIGLKHRNEKIVIESTNWLDHIVTNVNPQLQIDSFTPTFISLVVQYNNKNSRVIQAIVSLLGKFYGNKQFRPRKYALMRELEIQNVPQELQNEILNQVTLPVSNHMRVSEKFVNAGSAKVHINSRTDMKDSNISRSLEDDTTTKSQNQENLFPSFSSTDKALPVGIDKDVLMEKKQESQDCEVPRTDFSWATKLDTSLDGIRKDLNYTIDESIVSIEIRDEDTLKHLIVEGAPIFHSKETEFNWSRREKFILKLRSILHGNASKDFVVELTATMKELSESICKAMSSLRTTLSTHACQLIKESAIILKSAFDGLIDYFLPTLTKLCSATKHLTSTNAQSAISAIYVNCSYSQKLMHRITLASSDKNIQPRTYSGIWLQIILVRFHSDSSFSKSNGTSITGIEHSNRIVLKLLNDPNPKVRQVAKDLYWQFCKYFPNEAETLVSKLDSNTIKAIERTKPTNTIKNVPSLTSGSNNKERPSIKKMIMAKNKELRGRQKECDSRPSSRANSGTKVFKDANSQSKTKSSDFSEKKVSQTHHVQNSSSNLEDADALVEHSQVLTIPSEKADLETYKDLPEKNVSEALNIRPNEDPILKFLASNDTDLITEGVNLLKYAVMGEEELPEDVNQMLRSISIRQPDLLGPLFLTTENLFKKSAQFFCPEDYIRVCCILVSPFEPKTVDFIISVVDLNDIYEAIIRLLSYAVSISNVLDHDGELTMQIIKFKSTIVSSLISFLLSGLDKIPITDRYFSKLTSNLLDLVGLIRSTEIEDLFSKLLVKLYSINPGLFGSELSLRDSNTKEDVESIVGIDGALDLSKNISSLDTNLTTLFDLTKVNPSRKEEDLSPVKFGTEFTMLVPVVKANNDYTFVPNRTEPSMSRNSIEHFDANISGNISKANEKEETKTDVTMEVESIKADDDIKTATSSSVSHDMQPDIVVNELEQGDSGDDEPINIKEFNDKDNIFLDNKQTKSIDNLSNRDASSELAEDFAQFEITRSPFSSDGSAIQHLINRIDPLQKISSRGKSINIYDDSESTGSPQKVREYNYSEHNWFNFKLAMHFMKSPEKEISFSVDEYETILFKLGSCSIQSSDFIRLLDFLQRSVESPKFSEYLNNQGYYMLENSLFDLLGYEMSCSYHINVLVIIKQLLIDNVELNLTKLLKALSLIRENNEEPNKDLANALSETFDEILTGIYSSSQVFQALSNYFGKFNHYEKSQKVFILECLSKLMSISTSHFLIQGNLVSIVDDFIFPLIDSDIVEIRRFVVLCYGSLFRASTAMKANNIKPHEEFCSSVDNILTRLSLPQRRLVEYYSQN